MAESDVILLDSSVRRELLPTSDEPAGRGRLLITLTALTLTAITLAAHFFTPISWNIAVTRSLQSLTVPGLQKLMVLVSGFGNAPKLIAISLVALLACNKRFEAFWLTFSGLGGWFISMLLKPVFANPRPTDDVVAVLHHWNNGSFPSGHLVFYVCFFGFICFLAKEQMTRGSLLRRGVLLFSAALILLVGISRVFLGEHWASDLPGSYLLGVIWLTLSLKLYRGWREASRRPHDWFLPYRLSGK